MTDTPTPTDEEIAALCEELRTTPGATTADREAAAALEALQADLAKSRGIVMSLTQRLADAQKERDALQVHYEAASKAIGRSMMSSRPLSVYIKDAMAENARLAEHVKTLRTAADSAERWITAGKPTLAAEALGHALSTTAPKTDLNAAADSALQRMADNNDTAEEWATKLAESLPKGEV